MTTQKNEMSKAKKIKEEHSQSKTCFVIMPISDVDGYEPGHFDRVYNYIIKPACEKAGFAAKRADLTGKTNFIVIDILKQIVNSDMAICDLSSRNSNVFFELGLRQAFNLKTVLIKDIKTPRSFDIAGLRCMDYDENLRVDKVEGVVEQLSKALKDTMECGGDEVNSLIRLLAVDAAKLPDKVTLSNDSEIILRELQRMREDMSHLQQKKTPGSSFVINGSPRLETMLLPNGEKVELYKRIYIRNDELPYNEEFGTFIGGDQESFVFKKDGKIFTIKADDGIWKTLTFKDM